MDDCIFCKIVSGSIPASKVYDDKEIFAFLDIAPANKGHVLVVPKKHFELITEVPENILNSLIKCVKKVSSALLKENEGVNVIQNNGKAAGQLVKHFHFHVIPRNNNDNLGLTHWKPLKYEESEMALYLDKIKKHLNKTS